jgi:hypothetical protein
MSKIFFLIIASLVQTWVQVRRACTLAQRPQPAARQAGQLTSQWRIPRIQTSSSTAHPTHPPSRFRPQETKIRFSNHFVSKKINKLEYNTKNIRDTIYLQRDSAACCCSFTFIILSPNVVGGEMRGRGRGEVQVLEI